MAHLITDGRGANSGGAGPNNEWVLDFSPRVTRCANNPGTGEIRLFPPHTGAAGCDEAWVDIQLTGGKKWVKQISH